MQRSGFKMKKRVKQAGVLSLFIAMCIIQGCSLFTSAYTPTPAQQTFLNKKTTLFTQVGMWTEKNQVIATNYSRGYYIPVNSSVTISEINNNSIQFKYNNQNITLINVENYTKVNISELFKRTFGPEKVKLSDFTQTEINAFSHGEVLLGMSKEAVIISRGYPPAHVTISLKENNWRYWRSRFDTRIYEFDDNKVVKIID